MGQLTAFSDEAVQLVGRAGPSVVRIGRDGRGAGVVIGAQRVATNAHNLRGDEVTVTFADGRVATGRVAGADLDTDLAVIEVDTGDAPGLEFSEDEAGPGSLVFAVTTTAGGGSRLTWGLISASGQAFRGPRGRKITDAIEHTAPLARGSSGGPVLDAQGRIVGLNTHRRGDGFYLAVPADAELRERLAALGRGEAPRRLTLGISVAPAHVARRLRRAVGLPPQDGLLVRDVDEHGPAGRAGVRPGDLLIEAGGTAVSSSDELFALLDGHEEGTSLALRIVRGVERLDVSVTFGEAREEGSA